VELCALLSLGPPLYRRCGVHLTPRPRQPRAAAKGMSKAAAARVGPGWPAPKTLYQWQVSAAWRVTGSQLWTCFGGPAQDRGADWRRSGVYSQSGEYYADLCPEDASMV
jgi:hypothetical protein